MRRFEWFFLLYPEVGPLSELNTPFLRWGPYLGFGVFL